MSTMFLVFVGVIAVALILLVFIIFKLTSSETLNNSSDSNSYSNNGSSSSNKKNLKSKITIKSLELPIKIMQIPPTDLQDACKTVFDSYKALDYKEGHIDRISVSEWHSWQVSLLLAFLKIEREFHIRNPREFFPDVILNLTRRQLEEEIDNMLQKYEQNVDYTKDRDTLSKHNIWNAREVGILFYYMAMYKVL